MELDYCILQSPFMGDKKLAVFFTSKGNTTLDANIAFTKDYANIVLIMESIGYSETKPAIFEPVGNGDLTDIDKIKNILETYGVHYNKRFEDAITEELNIFAEIAEKILRAGQNNTHKAYKKNIKKIPKDKTKKITPIKNGEFVTLYYYLFIECESKDSVCSLNLKPGFLSASGLKNLNFIRIMKNDFVRVENKDNPKKIILKSVKTNSDIIKQIPINYNNVFLLKQDNIFISFLYYIMDIKHNIPQNNRITITLKDTDEYENLIYISKSIKEEYKYDMKNKIQKSKIVESLKNCKVILQEKMKEYANSDEFESASVIKKDIKYIDLKTEQLIKMPKQISNSVIYRKFCAN